MYLSIVNFSGHEIEIVVVVVVVKWKVLHTPTAPIPKYRVACKYSCLSSFLAGGGADVSHAKPS